MLGLLAAAAKALQGLGKRGAGDVLRSRATPGPRVLWKLQCFRQLTSNELKPRDPVCAKIGVHALDQASGLVLQEDDGARLAFERQNGAVAVTLQFDGPSDPRELVAGDFCPAEDESGIAKARAGERAGGQLPRALARRLGPTAPRHRRLLSARIFRAHVHHDQFEDG